MVVAFWQRAAAQALWRCLPKRLPSPAACSADKPSKSHIEQKPEEATDQATGADVSAEEIAVLFGVFARYSSVNTDYTAYCDKLNQDWLRMLMMRHKRVCHDFFTLVALISFFCISLLSRSLSLSLLSPSLFFHIVFLLAATRTKFTTSQMGPAAPVEGY